jgi:hypothetical protein
MGETLKSYLESYGANLFTKSSHYLVEVKDEDEALKAWSRQVRDPIATMNRETVRVIDRKMAGVLKRQENQLFKWTAFCFRPARMQMPDGSLLSFLNLRGLKSISNTLWALVRVHEAGERQPLELCCYVGRDIPPPTEAIEPQLRIPLQHNVKLTADGGLSAGALFSDNTSLSHALQVTPATVDMFEVEDGAELSFTLHNVSDEDLTVMAISGRDFDDEPQELTGASVEGLKVGDVIPVGGSHTFSLRRESAEVEDLVKLSIGYLFGEPDEDVEEGEFDEEAMIELQGEDQRQLHTFLFQGELYEVMRRALQQPSEVLKESDSRVDLSELVEGDVMEDDAELETQADADQTTLLLNEVDLAGGSLGTIPLRFSTTRDEETFSAQAALNPDDEPLVSLQMKTLTFEGECALSSAFVTAPAKRKSRAKKAPQLEEREQVIEPIYLGSLIFYNRLESPDQDKLRDFILNCVAISALKRAIDLSTERPEVLTDDEGVAG